jgi:hypothetical protein
MRARVIFVFTHRRKYSNAPLLTREREREREREGEVIRGRLRGAREGNAKSCQISFSFLILIKKRIGKKKDQLVGDRSWSRGFTRFLKKKKEKGYFLKKEKE